jgi:hypothetical protein
VEGEPSQVEAVAVRVEERGLADIHLGGDLLHPGFVGGAVQWADHGGIASEGDVVKASTW